MEILTTAAANENLGRWSVCLREIDLDPVHQTAIMKQEVGAQSFVKIAVLNTTPFGENLHKVDAAIVYTNDVHTSQVGNNDKPQQ